MKTGVDEAFQLGATSMRVFSGKHPGDERKEEAKKILIDSLREVCRYTNEQGPMEIYMKVFDYDIDKSFLIGHFQDAADVTAVIAQGVSELRRPGGPLPLSAAARNARRSDSAGEAISNALPHRFVRVS